MIVDDVEGGIDDRCRESGAVAVAHVPVVEVQSTGAIDLGRERQLPAPILDDRPPKEGGRPVVHFAGDLFRHDEELWILVNRQFQVSLVVQRHRRHLAERVFTVEHPAIGATQQRVGHVAQASLDRGARARRRAGALDPLPLEIAWNLAADEVAGAGLADGNRRAADGRAWVEEPDSLAPRSAIGAPLDA